VFGRLFFFSPVRTASPPASRLHRHRLTPLLPPPTAGAGSPSSAAGAGSASHLLPPAPAAAVAGSRGDRRAREAPDLLPPPPAPALLLFSSLRCWQPRLPARAVTDVHGKRPREAPAPAEDDAPMGMWWPRRRMWWSTPDLLSPPPPPPREGGGSVHRGGGAEALRPRFLIFFPNSIRSITSLANKKMGLWMAGIHPRDQCFVFNARQLDDNQSLADCNITHNSTIHFVFGIPCFYATPVRIL
jgi:hypothetical protein